MLGAENSEGTAPIGVAQGDPQESEKAKRFRSEIEFPYADLESAVDLAHTIHDKTGGSCEVEELAAWMNQSAAGGTFRSRLSAARMFGLIETASGRVTLTQLGRDVLDKTEEKHARSGAFLNLELYRQMYEQHRGNALPPPPAVERQMEQLGVSPKQKDRARQVFMKSATFAGFIDATTGRFIRPGHGGSRDASARREEQKPGGGSGGSGEGGDGLALDPLLLALLKKVPPTGADWPAAQRVRWFRTFAMNVSQIYDKDEEPVEMEIRTVSTGI